MNAFKCMFQDLGSVCFKLKVNIFTLSCDYSQSFKDVKLGTFCRNILLDFYHHHIDYTFARKLNVWSSWGPYHKVLLESFAFHSFYTFTTVSNRGLTQTVTHFKTRCEWWTITFIFIHQYFEHFPQYGKFSKYAISSKNSFNIPSIIPSESNLCSTH